MKTKKGFNLRTICGESIIVAEGKENIDFSNIISLNETATYLWEKIEGKLFSIDELVTLLTEQYDVDEKTARDDSKTLIQQWLDAGIVEE